ncbi:MAG TPA: CBS domain-containing protein [Candidatus Saccharimonadales bacterium]
MSNLTAAIVLLLLALLGVAARKTYFAVPPRELKRRAAKREQPAAQLYRAVAYGSSLRTLLWLYIGLTSAASLVLLARFLPVWVSLLIVGPLLWIAFSLLPATRTTKLGTRATLLMTPPIVWLLNYLHPTLSRGATIAERRYAPSHTGIFERDDLLGLIEQQQQQADNRLSDEKLEIIKRALTFDDRKVGDVMTPRKRIKVILADDTIGPILIDEVHKSGQDFALVRESRKGDFVGSLAFRQLNLSSTGKVRGAMRSTVYYLHEDDSLGQALHAFFLTNYPVFVVINSAEDYVGTLTITDVLKQLLGHIPGDNFDQYADLAAVAARHSGSPAANDSEETPVKTDEEVIE